MSLCEQGTGLATNQRKIEGEGGSSKRRAVRSIRSEKAKTSWRRRKKKKKIGQWGLGDLPGRTEDKRKAKDHRNDLDLGSNELSIAAGGRISG